MIIPFGKHKGKTVRDLPLSYLSWFISFVGNRPELLAECKKEFKARGHKLKDLEREVEKFKDLGVFDENGKTNRERVAEIRQWDKGMRDAHFRVQMEPILDHLDATIGESNGHSLMEDELFASTSDPWDDGSDGPY